MLMGLAITVIIDPYLSRKHRRVMLAIIVLSITLIVQNVWEDYLAAGPLHWFLRTTLAVYGYTVRPVFLILFLYIVQPERKYLGCWALAALNGALHLTAYFSPLVFHIDKGNHYQGGPLHTATYVVSAILLGFCLFQSVRDYRTMRKQDLLIPALVVVMISTSVLLDRNVGLDGQPVTFLTFAIVICSVFYYIWLHLRLVREHEDDLKAQQRIQIMLSQIKPHFLYNTLGAIEELCIEAPRARDAIHTFSIYLRGNMDTLSQAELIPFEREMNHTKLFLELEKMRFGDDLTIVYDLECTDFSIPTLTLQPIVENAVTHGVRMTESGQGTVTIQTREFDDRFEVVVLDDGPGFDPRKHPSDGRSHVGIANVRERLHSACGGSLRIESGNGTRATIILPKEGQLHADFRD